MCSDLCSTSHFFLSLHVAVPPLTSDPGFFCVGPPTEAVIENPGYTRAGMGSAFCPRKQPEVLGCLPEI